jgi:hypothetical protein
MGLINKNFDSLTTSDLDDLIRVGMPEGILLEYKSALYGNGDTDVKEYLKDISSFANTSGGHLVIGLQETGGAAVAFSLLVGLDVDKELLRLENIARDGLEPRIVGLRMKAVAVEGSGHAVIISIPKSWNPPHRVSARGQNRIYARNSGGAYELSVEELRVLFTRSANTIDRVRAFRSERLARIESDDAIVPLAQSDSMLTLHVVPLSAVASTQVIDIEKAYGIHQKFRPMSAMGMTPRFNFEGVINISGGDQCYGYTQLFRSGAIEAVKVGITMTRPQGRLIPSLDLDKTILEVVPMYMDVLKELDILPPIVVMTSLTGVRGAILGISNQQFVFDQPTPIRRDLLELPEIVFEAYGTSERYVGRMRPAFDALWSTAGYSKSRYFDAEDRWIGDRGLR